MGKFLFRKFLVSYLVVIAVTLLGVTAVFSRLLDRYYFQAKMAELTRKGTEIARIAEQYVTEPAAADEAEALLVTLDRFLDARLFLIGRDGRIIASTAGPKGPRGLRLDVTETERVLAGEVVARKAVHPRFGQMMLSVAVPVRIGSEVVGGLLLHAPVVGMVEALGDLRRLVIYSAGGATLVAAVLGFALSRSMSRPLSRMNRVALEMAEGRFDQTVGVQSRDEIGQLARSIDYLAHRLRQTVSDLAGEKEKVERIVADMAEGVVAVDDAGRIILLNEAARRALGIEGACPLGAGIESVPECRPVWPLFAAALEMGSHHEAELEVGRTPVTVLVRVSPLGCSGGISGAVAVVQDITERRRLERMRQEFVANVSHELRTPLTSIQALVETLADGMVEDERTRERYLASVLSETIRLNRLISDLLDMSAMESGKVEWKMAETSLAPLISRVVSTLAAQAAERGLTLELALPGALPPVIADADRIEQVIINLLANAMQFTPAGGRVRVRAEADGETVAVAVEDTGVGIDEAELPLIWERFHKVDRARRRAGGAGTGLGLAIVKQIVEAHGGAVGVESVPGKGSTFTFTLRQASPGEPEGGDADGKGEAHHSCAGGDD